MSPTAWDFHHGDKVLEDTTKIRNICILAHVDHGKTTIADSLVASNGIISNRLAGQLRYMDDREDEQSRGITMKASTVTLLHRCGPDNDSLHAINLIDSPGHVDFSSEVSTAVRLADGAIIVVDVVEGVSAQTHVVLRQAWQERLQPVLVLNKMDRLILELHLTPAEAYEHLQRILEQINAITSALFMHQLLQKDAQADIEPDTGADDGSSAKVFDFIEAQDDESIYFEPARGNVVFASAIDGWGFSLNQFAQIMAKKLGCETKVKQLQKVLWGDYYLTKEKGQPKIKGKALAKGKVPLFASYVLATVWEVYQAACVDKDKEKISHIGKKVGIKVSMKDLQNADPKGCIRTLMGQWLPLARATMNMVCECVPSPVHMNEDRVTKFLYSLRPRQYYSKKVYALEEELKGNHTEGCDITTAFISKMVAVNIKHLPHEHQAVAVNDEDRHRKRVELLARRVALGKDQGPKVVTDETNNDTDNADGGDDEGGKNADDDGDNDYAGFQLSDNHESANVEKEAIASDPADEKERHIMIAHTRVFTGMLREGQTLHVLGAQYDPEKPTKSIQSTTIEKIYILMGREFVRVKQAPAGSIVGLQGLGEQVPKTATLSSSLDCPPFCAIDLVGKPIVRVALDTDSINDMPKLKEAMKRLHQADPGVEVLVQSTGELVLVAAGEVHIERCVRDLQTIFCPGLKFNMSKPIVPLRETIVKMSTVDMRNETIDENNVHVVKTQHYLLKGCPENTSSTSDVVVTTGNKHLILAVRAIPLPESVTTYLVDKGDRIRFYHSVILSSKHNQANTVTEMAEGEESDGDGEEKYPNNDDEDNNNTTTNTTTTTTAADDSDTTADEHSSTKTMSLSEEQVNEVTEMRKQLATLFAAEGPEWVGMESRILAFGPRHCGPNILFSKLAGFDTNTFFANCGIQANNDTHQEGSEYFNTLVTAFQQQTVAGPLASEPMMGVAFEVTSVTVTELGSASDSGFYGQLLTTCKNAMKWSFLSQSVRLMTAMYMCEMLVDSSTLGKVYAVLGRRNCKIVNEEMKEGTDSFIVQALVPVTGSFGFSEEIRRKSSGLATPQLIFSHWGIIYGDPFWIPTTEEELEHYGEKADAPNPGMDLLNDVRKRKGLHVEKKIVEFAEKQRTLGKNK